jgi:hypothetical protein
MTPTTIFFRQDNQPIAGSSVLWPSGQLPAGLQQATLFHHPMDSHQVTQLEQAVITDMKQNSTT